MDFRKIFCLSVCSIMLSGTVSAGESNSLLLPSLNVQNNSGYQLAGMQFLPDMADSGLGGFSGSTVDDNYGGDEIVLKGCPDGYQTSGCSGSTPFTVSTTRAENGNSCYQCRAFEANDCEKDGFYQKSYWDALKPQAALNLPKESMFAQLFGNIFGFRMANALVTNVVEEEIELCKDCGTGGGIIDTGGTTVIEKPSTDSSITLTTVTRKITDETVSANVYTFNKTDVCKYDASYIKGEWVGGCDTTIYKYDSSNCKYILAGKKCGDKWDGCYKCSELYTLNGIGNGPYEPGTTTVGSGTIINGTCQTTSEGCLYACLIQIDLPCNVTNYPYTSCPSGTLGGASCTTDSGVKRYTLCSVTCNVKNFPYTTLNCSEPGGITCQDGSTTRYKMCLELANDNQGCITGYTRTRPSCAGTIVTDPQGCFCCNNPNGTQCIISSLDGGQLAL